MISFLGYLGVLFVAGIVAFLIYYALLPIKIRPWVRNKIHAVDHSQSEKADLDFAIDDSGTLHLVWASEGMVHYQQKSESDATWSEPEKIAEGEAAYIQVSADRLHVLCLGERVAAWSSPKVERSWSLVGSFVGKRGFKKHAFHAQEGGRYMYLTFEYAKVIIQRPYTEENKAAALAPDSGISKARLYFIKTEDYGATWSEPFDMGPAAVDSPPWEPPTMSVWRDKIIILWKGLKSRYVGSRSNDRGDSWSEQADLFNLKKSQVIVENYILNAHVAHDESGIHIFGDQYRLINGGTVHWMFTEKGAIEKGRVCPRNTDFLTSRYNKGPVEVVYKSNKYYSISFARSFHRLLTVSSKSEPWADLFIWSSKTRKRRLITPKYSYISHQPTKKSIAFNRSGNKLYVFWHGRKKAGRRLNQYGYEPEILYTVVTF